MAERQGIPRWLVIAFGGKLLLVALLVGGLVWWASR